MNDGLGMIRELTLAQDKNIFLRKKKKNYSHNTLIILYEFITPYERLQ